MKTLSDFSPTLLSRCVVMLCLGGSFIEEIAAAADKGPKIAVQQNNGVLNLDAGAVTIQGRNAKLKGEKEKEVIWWTSTDTSLEWVARVRKPGHYRVELTYAIVGANNGGPLAISIGDQTLKALPKVSNGFDDYKTGSAGEVEIGEARELPITIKALEAGREYVINIRGITLQPAAAPTTAIDITGDAIAQSADGSFHLTASDASIRGMNAQLEGDEDRNIGYWDDIGTSIVWIIHVDKPGDFRVEPTYSLMQGYEGSKIAVSVDDQSIIAHPKATKGWKDYVTAKAGEISIKAPGDIPVIVKPVSKPWGFVMNLRSLTLTPIETPTKAIDISDKPIAQAEDGSVKLTPQNAFIDGQAARIEGGDRKCLVWWNSASRFITWPIRLKKPGTFNVELSYSLDRITYAGEVQFNADGKDLTVNLPQTVIDSSDVSAHINGEVLTTKLKSGKGWDDYKTENLGEVTFDKPTDCDLVLKSTRELGGVVMHLRSIVLTPVAAE